MRISVLTLLFLLCSACSSNHKPSASQQTFVWQQEPNPLVIEIEADDPFVVSQRQQAAMPNLILISGTELQDGVAPYYIMDKLVTMASWQACIDDETCLPTRKSRKKISPEQPVTLISKQAVLEQYIPWLNRKTGKSFRLASAIEWQIAAKSTLSKSLRNKLLHFSSSHKEFTASCWGFAEVKELVKTDNCQQAMAMSLSSNNISQAKVLRKPYLEHRPVRVGFRLVLDEINY